MLLNHQAGRILRHVLVIIFLFQIRGLREYSRWASMLNKYRNPTAS